MPAEAGIQVFALGPRFRGHERNNLFYPRLSSGAARMSVQNTLYFERGE
jgi:hypothetical protein